MTECTKNLQRVGLRRNVWRKCLLAAGVLLMVPLFFSCKGPMSPKNTVEQRYTVYHHWEKVEGSDYEVSKTELKGSVGEATAATAEPKVGFELDTAKHPDGKIQQETIKDDGSTVVDIYYARKTVTLTFDPAGGNTIDPVKGKFGTRLPEVAAPKKDGHTFRDWDPELPATFPATDTTYKAVWAEGTLPKYTVQHWLQQIDAAGIAYDGNTHQEPNYKLDRSETKADDAGKQTEAKAKEYEGFDKPEVTQQTINADGSTVVAIYYLRKQVTLTFDPNGGTIDGKAENKTLSGKFGETILKLNEPKKDRHSFTEWEPKLPETFPSTDTTYKAVWVEGTLPTYTVQHWQQQIEDLTGKVYDGTTHATPNYKLKDTETKHGKEGTTTAATSKEKAKGYEGFDKPEITQQKITADGKTVVAIYYLRKQVTLTFKPNGGKFGESTEDKTVQGKFGERVTDSIPAPTNGSMKFAGWKSENKVTLDPPATFPEKNTVYIAQWKNPQAGSYKVIHWKQPITGDTYTDKEEVPASGTIDEDTQATAKTYTGFHLNKDQHPDGKIKQEKITADDKTVVNIYYDRDVFTATFKLDNGQNDIVQTGRFEAALTKPTPEKTGMAFDKWEPDVPATFTSNGTYTAKWKTPAPEQANYKVEHWLQQINTETGKVYAEGEHKSPNYAQKDITPETKTGTKGAQTQAEAKEYEGFEKPTDIHQETIAADGSTVVRIYYVRKTITLTFDAKGGKIDGLSTKTLIGKYEETIKTDDVHDPIKDNGDKFSAWSPKENIAKFPAENKTYEAQWATFDAIVVTKWPSKTTYIVGEPFDPTDMEIHAKYSDGSSPRLQDNEYETDFATVSASAGNDKTVTVKHTKYPSKTATFKVTIKDPPSETFAIGDIIDSTNNKKYKAADFTALPAGSPTWSNYYVIVKVNGASYVGVRYLDNTGYDPELGNSPNNTYPTPHGKPAAPNRYLKPEEVTLIVTNKTSIKTSMDKIKKITTLSDYTNTNCISSEDNGLSFQNGNGDSLSAYTSGSFIPFAAREFN